jgi:hypothetical protein
MFKGLYVVSWQWAVEKTVARKVAKDVSYVRWIV